jgi:hypothetical protein
MSSRNLPRFEANTEPLLPRAAIISLSNLLQLPKLSSAATNAARSVCLSHDLTVDQYDRLYQNPVRIYHYSFINLTFSFPDPWLIKWEM